MAAHLQPTDDQIEQVSMCIPGITRDEAIQRLKVAYSSNQSGLRLIYFGQGNNNNVDQAVNEYFDNPEGGNKVCARSEKGSLEADISSIDGTRHSSATIKMVTPTIRAYVRVLKYLSIYTN